MQGRARTLRNAIIEGNEAKVKACLEETNVDLDLAPFPGLVYEGGYSLLQFAAHTCQKNIVQLILEHGADPDARDGLNGTALHVAVGMKGNHDVVKTLLDYGAKVDAAPHWFGSALQIAVNVPGNAKTTRILLDHGANVNTQIGRYHTALQTAARVSDNEQQLKILLEAGADATIQGGRFGTALQAAAYNGQEDAVRSLLPQSTAVVNAVGGQYGSALNAAALSGNIAIVQLLVQHGADLRLIAPLPSKSSSLHFAVTAGDPSVLNFLLDNGAAIHLDIKNADGETALFRSVSSKIKGNVRIAKILLERGASADNENYAGIFPLEYAVRENDLPMASLLYPYAKKSRERINISRWRKFFSAHPNACLEVVGGESPKIDCITSGGVIEKYIRPSLWIRPTTPENGGLIDLPIQIEAPIRAIAIPSSWTQKAERVFAFSCRWWRRTAFGAWEVQTYGVPSITAVRGPPTENCFLECSLFMPVPVIPSPVSISAQYPMTPKFLRQEQIMGITWIMRRNEQYHHVKENFTAELQSFVFLHTTESARIPSSSLDLVSEFLKSVYEIWSNTLASLDQLVIEMERGSVLKYGGKNPKLIQHLIFDAQLIDDIRANHKKQINNINLFCNQYLSEPYEVIYEDHRDKVRQMITRIRKESRKNSQEFLRELTAISDASQKAIQLEFNLTSINEAQKSTSTNRSMKRLSWTTFVFLPLLFVASLFGMNVDILSRYPPWWWYIPFAFGATFSTLVVWLVFKRSEGWLQHEYVDDSSSSSTQQQHHLRN